MRAWVISIYSIHSYPNRKVLGILSARKNAKHIRELLTNLHDIFCLTIEEQKESAKYNNPTKIYEASKSDVLITIGHDPCFEASLCSIVSLEESKQNNFLLTWKTSRKYIFEKSCNEVKCIEGVLEKGSSLNLWNCIQE